MPLFKKERESERDKEKERDLENLSKGSFKKYVTLEGGGGSTKCHTYFFHF